jgi:hypothetical protein
MLQKMAVIIRRSWGEDFSLDFIVDLFRKAASFEVATAGPCDPENIVGFACITRYRGCPYDYDDKRQYIVAWFVGEKYRRRGIGTRLKEGCVDYAIINCDSELDDGYLYATTDSDEASRNLRHLGLLPNEESDWELVDEGCNEDGAPTRRWRKAI